MTLTERQKKHFYQSFVQSHPDKCWPWNGFLEANGYARMRAGRFGNRKLVHRVSYFLANGPFDESRLVCHKCDNRCCVNPNHLFIGDHSDNNSDTYRKGRNPRQVLSKEQVDAIRILLLNGTTHRRVAAMYGVGKSTITAISSGINWKNR